MNNPPDQTMSERNSLSDPDLCSREIDRDQRRKTSDKVENIMKIYKSNEIKLGWQGGARAGYKPTRGS